MDTTSEKVECGGCLQFEILAECSTSRARAADLTLPHSVVPLPIFMPVGTQGTMKGLTSDQLRELGCKIMLSNTYHLGLRPGQDILDKAGGLHKFMDWDNSLLTDSGGFQMVSLLALAEITEDGVTFQSPHDGSQMLLTPEKSIDLQNSIGADIIMQLDDVVSSTVTGPRVEEAMWRSIRWLDRCIKANKRPDCQNLFAIIQGGLDPELRTKCLQEMVRRNTPGYAIGGLSGGESKHEFWKIVKQCAAGLPRDKPRYLMGVGYALDLVVCVALGVDMFDCVFPTRTARFGVALTRYGQLQLKSQDLASDFRPISEDCSCQTCKLYTRAALHSIVTREEVCCHLISTHNIAYQLNLMREARESIIEGKFPNFVRKFVKDLHGNEKCPSWAVDALNSVGISLE
eukprot:m.4573 g.4573  ORF g.4573 m.4573 type:complete len:401 (+) comp3020_c0_seq2:269-1471(+)